MRILFVVNASASSVTPRTRVVIQKALSADHRVTVATTARRGHATRLAQGAAADGVDVVVVLGGDGTLNEAANGLAGTSTALAVLPGGSTNVFARTIGTNSDPVEATGETLAALARGSIRSVNLGRVNGRYFLFHVGLGFDAAVVQQVERRATLKRYAGHALFLAAAVDTWWRHYERDRPRFAVELAGGRSLDDVRFGICLNTNPYTYLGERPLDLVPGSGLDDGLALVTFDRLDLVTMLATIAGALRGGGLHDASRPDASRPDASRPDSRRPDASRPDSRRLGRPWHRPTVTRDLAGASVSCFGPLPYQVDGDFLGYAEHFDLRSEPRALRLVLPADERPVLAAPASPPARSSDSDGSSHEGRDEGETGT